MRALPPTRPVFLPHTLAWEVDIMMQRSYACCAPCERPAPPPCPRPAPCPPQTCQCDECLSRDCGPRCAPPVVPCRPSPCCYPSKPFPSNGFLLPRIVAAGREWQRRCQLTLAVDGLPLGAEAPLTLLEVTACGQPSWETLECDDPRALALRVRVPLACQVRDRNNRCYTGRSAITVDVRMRMSCPRSECWRGNVMVLPCVRLICVPCPEETPSFDVLLEVLVEAYMTRWEPCLSGEPQKPCCPDLPLFPQPCFR